MTISDHRSLIRPISVIKLRDGERMESEVHDNDAVIRRPQQRVSLEGLFRGRSPDEWRADYAGFYDWGADIGREIIPE